MLRLVAPSSIVSEYTHIMNEDIIVKKNSKIGLLNCALPLSVKKIVIDETNNQIQFKVTKKGNLRTVYLTPGFYNNEEFTDLLNKQLNYALDFRTVASDGGFEHHFVIDEDDGILEWQIRRVNLTAIIFPAANINKINITGSSRIMKRTDANTDYTAFVFTDEYFIQSCGTYRCKLVAIGDLVFGLTIEHEDKTKINADDYEYGIVIDATANVYKYIHDSYTYNTAIVPAVNDILSLDLNLGTMEYNIYRANALFATLHSVPNTDLEYKMEAAATLISPAASIGGCQWTKDPYSITTADGVGYDTTINKKTNVVNYGDMSEEEALGAIPGPSNRHTNRQFTYNFPQPRLAAVCGFETLTGSTTLTADYFAGKHSLDDSNTPSNVIIELVNVPLQTYDSRTHKRRNIVAVIPALSLQNNKLVYDSSPPIMLDMNNKYEINLREITVRVLNINDELLLLESPGAEITLLIEDDI